MHAGLVLLCAAAFLRYTLFGLGPSAPRPNHGAAMFLIFSAGLPFLVAGDAVTHLAAQFK